MDLCPKMLIICLRGVSVHCNKVNFNLGSEHNIIEPSPDGRLFGNNGNRLRKRTC